MAVTGGGLKEVPLDDRRWGGREEGEVYARENSDYIVWYWPHGGEATFDPTRLGNRAAWHDYRLASGNINGGSHTRIDLTSGMRIFFSDSGGGVSIFERISSYPPSPAAFLAPYKNPQQGKLPDQAGYPFGQRMWLSMYSENANELVRMHAAGLTMSGPHYSGCSPSDYPPNLSKAHSYGMKAFWRLYTGSGQWSHVLDKMKSPEGRSYLENRIKQCVDAVLHNATYNDTVIAWYGYPEEPINRSGQPIADQREYMTFVRDLIVQLDPKKRPLFWSERTDSSGANIKGNAIHGAGVMKQNYLIKANNYDYDGHDLEERFIIGQWVRDMQEADDGNAYTGKQRPVIPTLSMYIDPDDAQYRNEVWLHKAITHDFYLSIAMGAHGANAYTWTDSSTHSQTTKELQEKIYLDVMGVFAKNKLDKVFLWGDERDDVTLEITGGPKTFKWSRYTERHTEPSLKLRNLQYERDRYILLVNSAKNAVAFRLSGFPPGLKRIEMLSAIAPEPGTSISDTIQSLGVRLYKITP